MSILCKLPSIQSGKNQVEPVCRVFLLGLISDFLLFSPSYILSFFYILLETSHICFEPIQLFLHVLRDHIDGSSSNLEFYYVPSRHVGYRSADVRTNSKLRSVLCHAVSITLQLWVSRHGIIPNLPLWLFPPLSSCDILPFRLPRIFTLLLVYMGTSVLSAFLYSLVSTLFNHSSAPANANLLGRRTHRSSDIVTSDQTCAYFNLTSNQLCRLQSIVDF